MSKKHKKSKHKRKHKMTAKIVSLVERFTARGKNTHTSKPKSTSTSTSTYTYRSWFSESNMMTLLEKMQFKHIDSKDVEEVIKLFPKASKIELVKIFENLEQYRINNPPKKESKCLLPAPVTAEK